MKQLSFFSFIIFFILSSKAQNVGINATGTSPNASAGLDVDFTNKGVLIPRVALTARNSNAPIGAGIATGLLVYNTATAGTFPNNVYPGFYYWNGTVWLRLISGIGDGWQVNGNTLTGVLPTAPNEFIGTLNAADFIFRTNNTNRMFIASTGQVVINSPTFFTSDILSAYATGTLSAINGYAIGGAGVYGEANSGSGFGVVGYNLNTNGTGMLTGGNNVALTYLINGSGLAANGSSFAIISFGKNAASGNGINASGNNLTIVSFASGSGGTFKGQTFGVYGIANSNANNTWGGYYSNANSGAGSSYAYVGGKNAAGTNRKIEGNGSVATIVKDLNGNLVTLTCPEAPEILFEDYGIGQLINGKTHIDLDPIFSKNVTINEKHPLRVFIQLEGECNGVYVTNKTKTGFDVIELNNGKSNVSFVYHVVANRADDKDENGNIISNNENIRFGPALPAQIPLNPESAELNIHDLKRNEKK